MWGLDSGCFFLCCVCLRTESVEDVAPGGGWRSPRPVPQMGAGHGVLKRYLPGQRAGAEGARAGGHGTAALAGGGHQGQPAVGGFGGGDGLGGGRQAGEGVVDAGLAGHQERLHQDLANQVFEVRVHCSARGHEGDMRGTRGGQGFIQTAKLLDPFTERMNYAARDILNPPLPRSIDLGKPKPKLFVK